MDEDDIEMYKKRLGKSLSEIGLKNNSIIQI